MSKKKKAAPEVEIIFRDPEPAVASAAATPAPAASPALALAGCVESLSHREIVGWAWDPLDPDAAVPIEIYDGTQLLMRVRADIYREDLRAAGLGNGRHGFAIGNPGALLPYARHLVAVRRAADGVDLQGSPPQLPRAVTAWMSSLPMPGFLPSTSHAGKESCPTDWRPRVRWASRSIPPADIASMVSASVTRTIPWKPFSLTARGSGCGAPTCTWPSCTVPNAPGCVLRGALR